jgi:hypothetical protein
MVLEALERKELQSAGKSAYKNYGWKNVAVKIKEKDLTLLSRELDRLGYETLGNLVRDLILGKITNLTEEKQIEAMKSNLQSFGQNTAQLGGHYDFYKNIDVEDMLKERMKRYYPKTARCFVSYFGRYSDIIAVSVDCKATNCTWGYRFTLFD